MFIQACKPMTTFLAGKQEKSRVREEQVRAMLPVGGTPDEEILGDTFKMELHCSYLKAQLEYARSTVLKNGFHAYVIGQRPEIETLNLSIVDYQLQLLQQEKSVVFMLDQSHPTAYTDSFSDIEKITEDDPISSRFVDSFSQIVPIYEEAYAQVDHLCQGRCESYAAIMVSPQGGKDLHRNVLPLLNKLLESVNLVDVFLISYNYWYESQHPS